MPWFINIIMPIRAEKDEYCVPLNALETSSVSVQDTRNLRDFDS